jgi:hypothetical protein
LVSDPGPIVTSLHSNNNKQHYPDHYLQGTFKGHGDGDVKDGDDLALALVDINISGDRGDGEGLDGGAVGFGCDTAELGLEVGLCPVDAVLVNPVPMYFIKIMLDAARGCGGESTGTGQRERGTRAKRSIV